MAQAERRTKNQEPRTKVIQLWNLVLGIWFFHRGSPSSAHPASTHYSQLHHSPLRQPSIWQAPLVPVAMLLTAGIVADRYLSIPLSFSLVIILVSLMAWGATSLTLRI